MDYRGLGLCVLLGSLGACFSDPLPATDDDDGVSSGEQPGTTSGTSASTTAQGSTSAGGSMSTGSTTEDVSSSSSEGVDDTGDTDAAIECEQFPSAVQPVDADVIVVVDAQNQIDWNALSEVFETWAMNAVNFAVLLPNGVQDQISFIPTCDDGCSSCTGMGNHVFLPYENGEALQGLLESDEYSCIYRPALPNGNAPTQHVWLITESPGQPLPALPAELAGSRYHVACPGCGEDDVADTDLGELVMDSAGTVGDLVMGLGQQGAMVGARRVGCSWPYVDLEFEEDLIPLAILANETLANVGFVPAIPIEKGLCSRSFNPTQGLDDYFGEFYFDFEGPQPRATFCPEMCFLAQLDPFDATVVTDQLCPPEALK